MATSVRRGEPHTPGSNKRTTTTNQPLQRREEDFNFYLQGMLMGAVGGIIIGLILWLTSDAAGYQSLGWKFGSMFIMGIIIWVGMTRYERHLLPDQIYKKGLIFGLYVAIMTGVAVLIVNTIIYLLFGTGSMNMLSYQVNSTTDFMVAEAIWMFVLFVFGMIFSFIAIQFLKTTAPALDHQADSDHTNIVVIEE